MKAALSTGYWPTAVSPESMSADVPSRTAFATSLASARVGSGRVIIDSSICVAVIAGFPCSSAQRMIRFWTSGTAAGPISTPRSPRATMTASEALTIASSSSSASAFSIFAITMRLRVGGVQELAEPAAVRGRADEGERDVVDADRERELEVGEVLLGQRGHRDGDARDVDALVRADRAADRDHGARTRSPSTSSTRRRTRPSSIRTSWPGRSTSVRTAGITGRSIAGRAVRPADDARSVALDEDARRLEVADPDLRPLQVGDERERPAGPLLRLADEPGPLAVLVVRCRARS